ncbi:MAG: hypothetical protein ACKOYC_10445, partial [Bacteroidota bacterium]
MSKSSLTETGKTKRSDKVTIEFKKLFSADADIFDDILAKFDPQATGYPYKLISKSRNDFIDDMIDEFPSGLVINNKKINVSYRDFDQRIVTAALERQISGVTNTMKYMFSNHDTLLITIAILPDKNVKINKVEPLGSSQVKILNDMDLDGVIDDNDECKKLKGVIALAGCPDSDGDGIADKNDECPLVFGTQQNGGCPASTFAYSFVFSGGIGYQFNNNSIKAPELNDYAYSNLDKDRSNTGQIGAPGYKGSITLNGNLGYYFGRKKNNRNKGISLGISLTNYKSIYEIGGSKFEFKSNDGVNDYRRIVTMDMAREEMSFSILNIPLLFRYKEKFSPKAGFELFAGPSFISILTNSTYEAKFDFEGIYQLDNN